MNKKFSISSLIVILISFLFVIFATYYFGTSSMGLFFIIIGVGILIYIIGVILSVIAFARREKGPLKYIVAISVIIAIFFVGYVN